MTFFHEMGSTLFTCIDRKRRKVEFVETVSAQIQKTITIAKPRLIEIPAQVACRKPSPEAWSKQEVLGHLIDSALINHQRFVRGAFDLAEFFPGYEQNRWVMIQNYNERVWAELIEFWALCNLHLCQMLDCLPEDAKNNLCNIGQETPVPLSFVITDYLRHLKMHLTQILEDGPE
jgi:hypothetical protein